MIPNKKQILKYHFVETTQSTESVRRTLEMKSERDTYNRFSNFVQDEAKSNSIDNIENILEIELLIFLYKRPFRIFPKNPSILQSF